MNGKCKCCQQEKDLRMGFCFECVESESILVEGVDMYDHAPPKVEGLSESMSKLQFILSRYINIRNDK